MGFTAYVSVSLYIKIYGIIIKSAKVLSPVQVEYFLQNDPEWAAERLGNTDYSLAGSGCLVSVLSSVLNKLDISVNPKQLNMIFTECNIYDQYGEVIWHKIDQAIEGVSYRYDRIFFSCTIESLLEQGLLAIVKVRYNKIGVFHWVLIIGAAYNDFLIYDPLHVEKRPIPLQTHGKVYAYRVLVRE